MKSFFKNILSTIIGIVSSILLLVIILLVIIAIASTDNEVKIKKNSILKIDLSNNTIVERSPTNPLEAFNFTGEMTENLELKIVLDNIEKAKNDDNIAGIYINSPAVNAGM